MGAAYFYHLTRRPLAETLIMLLGKSREAGWKVAVRGTDEASLAALDKALWTGPDDTFLAHGMAGGPQDADQPILLTTATAAPNNASCVMSVHGADVAAEEVTDLDRVCIIFDGSDDAALNRARDQWKTLKNADVSAQYWSDAEGRWEKKAET